MAPPIDKAAKIGLLVLDVDGVLTDGRLHFSSDGSEIKSFDVRDGAGIKALVRDGVMVAVISGRRSAAVDTRMAELGIDRVFQGCDDKAQVLQALMNEAGVISEQVACVGDDTPDLPMFDHVGLAIGVADAHPEVIAGAHWTTHSRGGFGAVREVCDMILAARAGTHRTG